MKKNTRWSIFALFVIVVFISTAIISYSVSSSSENSAALSYSVKNLRNIKIALYPAQDEVLHSVVTKTQESPEPYTETLELWIDLYDKQSRLIITNESGQKTSEILVKDNVKYVYTPGSPELPGFTTKYIELDSEDDSLVVVQDYIW